MLPVFTAAEMRALDARAIATLGIPGIRLMEQAGAGAADAIARVFAPIRGKRVSILCGKGNNGGDGFVVARRLRTKGARVQTVLVARRDDVGGDARAALGRFRGRVEEIGVEADLDRLARDLGRAHVVVDALLGTGLTGPARGLMARAIELINAAERPVVSLDLPSGLGSDTGALLGPTVRAGLTTTFAGYKRSLLLHPGRGVRRARGRHRPRHPARRGRARHRDVPPRGRRCARAFPEADPRRPQGQLRPSPRRRRIARQDRRGGARGPRGAPERGRAVHDRDAAVAAAHRGGHAPRAHDGASGRDSRPRDRTFEARAAILDLLARRDAVALGPGLSLDPETQELVRELVAEVSHPMVVDADALSALAGHLDVLDRAAGPRILTPHPGEMARMLGTTVAEVQGDRLETARDFARRHRAHLALKGAGTVVAAPDGRVFINPTGNPGMATGGSGTRSPA